MIAPRGAAAVPERLALLPLIPLLCLLPPEVHGSSQAGAAGLIALAAALALGLRRAAGWGAVTAGTALLLPFALLAATPSVAVVPVATVLVAAGLALAGRAIAGSARTAAATLAVTAGAVGLYGIWQRLFGLRLLAENIAAQPALPDGADIIGRAATGRAFGTLTTPAALGGLQALALPITVGLLLGSRGTARAGWLILVALQLGALVASASATAAAALFLTLGLAAVSLPGQRRRVLAAGGLVAVVLLGIIALRGATLVDAADPDSPWRLRAGNFRSAVAMAADHPWLGVGPGGFGEMYPAYRRSGDNETRHVHNLPLEVVAEIGLPAGVVASALFFALFVGPALRRTAGDPWRRGVALGLAAFALHNLGDYTAWMPSLLWIVALLRGAISDSTLESTPVVARPGRWRPAAAAGVLLVVAAAAALAGAGLSRDARGAGRLAAWRGDHDVAFARAAQAVRFARWDPDAALFLARSRQGANPAALDAAERQAALELAERAVALTPARAAARATRAQARMLAGDAPGAFADLVEAARLYPLESAYVADRDRLERHLEAAAADAGRQ